MTFFKADCHNLGLMPYKETPLYYDQPQYDVFWQTVTELDVPVYLHPQATLPIVASLDFSHAPALLGPVQEYAVTLSTHILG